MASANRLPKKSATSFFQYASGGLILTAQRLPRELHENVLQIGPLDREAHDVPAGADQAGHHVGHDAGPLVAVDHQVSALGHDAPDASHPPPGAPLAPAPTRTRDRT